MATDGQAELKASMDTMIASMKSLMSKQDDLKKGKHELESSLAKKVDDTLQNFQNGIKEDMQAMTKRFENVDKGMQDLAAQLNDLKQRTEKLEGASTCATASSGGTFSAPGFGPPGACGQQKPWLSWPSSPQRGEVALGILDSRHSGAFPTSTSSQWRRRQH